MTTCKTYSDTDIPDINDVYKQFETDFIKCTTHAVDVMLPGLIIKAGINLILGTPTDDLAQTINTILDGAKSSTAFSTTAECDCLGGDLRTFKKTKLFTDMKSSISTPESKDTISSMNDIFDKFNDFAVALTGPEKGGISYDTIKYSKLIPLLNFACALDEELTHDIAKKLFSSTNNKATIWALQESSNNRQEQHITHTDTYPSAADLMKISEAATAPFSTLAQNVMTKVCLADFDLLVNDYTQFGKTLACNTLPDLISNLYSLAVKEFDYANTSFIPCTNSTVPMVCLGGFATDRDGDICSFL